MSNNFPNNSLTPAQIIYLYKSKTLTMKGTRRVNLVIFATMLVATVVSSCNKRSQLLYVSNLANESLVRKQQEQYRLKEGDVLYVQILTRDPQVSGLFNNRGFSGSVANNLFTTESSYYLYGYSVSDSGMVHLPILGKLYVKDLTVEESQGIIQSEVEKYLTDGLAVVKLLSYKITVLGEVKRPGVYTNFKDNLTLFEAIGLAGDFTDFGERSNVLVVRQTPDGLVTYRVNLHDKAIVASEAYHLLPNDMVIVEPRKGKIAALNTPNISIVLSTISTLALVLNIILK